MSNISPQTNARNTATALIREARVAGWARGKVEIKPDSTVCVDVGMADLDNDDDFLSDDLRLGK